MALLESYLTFNGNRAEAMRFHEWTLNGTMEMMTTHSKESERQPEKVQEGTSR